MDMDNIVVYRMATEWRYMAEVYDGGEEGRLAWFDSNKRHAEVLHRCMHHTYCRCSSSLKDCCIQAMHGCTEQTKEPGGD